MERKNKLIYYTHENKLNSPKISYTTLHTFPWYLSQLLYRRSVNLSLSKTLQSNGNDINTWNVTWGVLEFSEWNLITKLENFNKRMLSFSWHLRNIFLLINLFRQISRSNAHGNSIHGWSELVEMISICCHVSHARLSQNKLSDTLMC